MVQTRGTFGSRLSDAPHPQQVRNNTVDDKGRNLARTSKMLADDERCTKGSHRLGSRSSSLYFESNGSSSGIDPAKPENTRASSSTLNSFGDIAAFSSKQTCFLPPAQNSRYALPGCSDVSRPDLDVEGGDRMISGSSTVINLPDWSVDKYSSCKNGSSEGEVSDKDHDVHPFDWQDQFMSQPARAYGSLSNNFFADQRRPAITGTSHKPLRKGSSSKAPQTDDLTAPLLLDKKATVSIEKMCQSEIEGHAPLRAPLLVKNKSASNLSRQIGQSIANSGDLQNIRKSNPHASYGRRTRSGESGSGYREVNINGSGTGRRGLSNLACSSAADVLPSVSSSALSHFTCSSATDVLPSAPSSAISMAGHFRPRKTSRVLRILEGREAARGMHSLKQQKEDIIAYSGEETVDSQDQSIVLDGADLEVPRSLQSSFNHQRRADPIKTDYVNASSAFAGGRSSSSNHRHSESHATVSSRIVDGLRSVSRPNNSFVETIPAFGEEGSSQWASRRRRSLNGSPADLMGLDNGVPSRNLYSFTASTSQPVIYERQFTQPSVSGPPSRPPPLPPLATFAESSASQGGYAAASAFAGPDFPISSQSTNVDLRHRDEEESPSSLTEAVAFNPHTSSGETRSRLTTEGLSEILSALEYIERDEDLSYEQILMLEATILLGGMGLHDRYRDMRIDIDNMSYEELLALEERIGNVNTGLSEDVVINCVRIESFTAPSGYVPQDIEIKCSICQEEFEEAVELGVLECGHRHHIACIKQWLLQKNQCPICKASALT